MGAQPFLLNYDGGTLSWGHFLKQLLGANVDGRSGCWGTGRRALQRGKLLRWEKNYGLVCYNCNNFDH